MRHVGDVCSMSADSGVHVHEGTLVGVSSVMRCVGVMPVDLLDMEV